MVKNVAVLGCGPTGLLVAHAIDEAGHVAHVISKKVKSDIPGSQHLHGPVPGITSLYPEGTIQFVRMGTAAEYARKVYGDPDRETGWSNYYQVFPSWNVLKAYDRLWEKYENEISDMTVTVGVMPDLIDMYDVVISTIPAQEVCVDDRHVFAGVPYVIEKLPTPPADAHNEIVVYNGLPNDPWYRWSILGGKCSVEYPFSYTPIEPNGREFISGWKALSHDCDCWPTVWRCGRWAEWRHGITMYKAFQKASQIVREL